MQRPTHRRARTRRHHLLLPAVTTGVLSGAALITLPSAAAAMEAPEIASMAAIAPAAAGGSEATGSSSSAAAGAPADSASKAQPRTGPQDVLSGIELKAKPPPPPPPPPVTLPLGEYELTGRFGASSGLWSSTHTGLDFAAPEGADIKSVTSGVVTESGDDGAFGTKTVIREADGTLIWYCHQSSVDVSVGDKVEAGQVIGSVGSTGNVTGPHLHLEVHDTGDSPVDPEEWLAGKGVRP
ncbi:MAG TPA: M23 family metallopeptidase [Marmoricola sp.]|nr:M23 family metallopeptidase [Marmoricola sp.]